MMKKLIIKLVLALLPSAGELMAQDIQITRFDRNYTDLGPRVNPKYDNAGNACAKIRCYVKGNLKDYSIEPNLGIVERETRSGEIQLWVPQGTKRITVRLKGLRPLVGYEIPVNIEEKTAYDMEVDVIDTPPNHPVYISAGYNAMSIMGPSLALGFDLEQHKIELGAVYGLNKTDDLYFYDSNSNVKAAYSYKALRVQLRYGYEIEATDFLSIVPQIGGAYNFINGTDVVTSSSDTYQSASSISVFGALKFVASLNEHFKIQITPEYDFGVYKNNNCKMINKFDTTFKSWTDGFNLNIGVMVFF